MLRIRSDQLANILTAIAPTIPAATISSMTMYGTHRPVGEVTDVPHSGHVTVRLARFRSTSQCHVSETQNRGFACLNAPVNPHVGHVILELCSTAMLSTQRFQFGFIVLAGRAMPMSFNQTTGCGIRNITTRITGLSLATLNFRKRHRRQLRCMR